MFDANMRYLPKGKRFFAKVHSCGEGSKWYEFGIRRDDILICHMLNSGNDRPLVDVIVNGKTVTISDKFNSKAFCWMVYEGCLNGNGFINDESKRIAMGMLSNGT